MIGLLDKRKMFFMFISLFFMESLYRALYEAASLKLLYGVSLSSSFYELHRSFN